MFVLTDSQRDSTCILAKFYEFHYRCRTAYHAHKLVRTPRPIDTIVENLNGSLITAEHAILHPCRPNAPELNGGPGTIV